MSDFTIPGLFPVKKKKSPLQFTVMGDTPEEQLANAQNLIRLHFGGATGGAGSSRLPTRYDPTMDRAAQSAAARGSIQPDPRLLQMQLEATARGAGAQRQQDVLGTPTPQSYTPYAPGALPPRQQEAIPTRPNPRDNLGVGLLAALAGFIDPKGAGAYAAAPLHAAIQGADRDYQDNLTRYQLAQTQDNQRYQDAQAQREQGLREFVTNQGGTERAAALNRAEQDQYAARQGDIASSGALTSGLPPLIAGSAAANKSALEASLLNATIGDKEKLSEQAVQDARYLTTDERLREKAKQDAETHKGQQQMMRDYHNEVTRIAQQRANTGDQRADTGAQRALDQASHWDAMDALGNRSLAERASHHRSIEQMQSDRIRQTSVARNSPEVAAAYQIRLAKERNLDAARSKAGQQYETQFTSFSADPSTRSPAAKGAFIESDPVVQQAITELQQANDNANTAVEAFTHRNGANHGPLPGLGGPGFDLRVLPPGTPLTPAPKTTAQANTRTGMPMPTAQGQHATSNPPSRAAGAPPDPKAFSVRPGKPKKGRSLNSGLLGG